MIIFSLGKAVFPVLGFL